MAHFIIQNLTNGKVFIKSLFLEILPFASIQKTLSLSAYNSNIELINLLESKIISVVTLASLGEQEQYRLEMEDEMGKQRNYKTDIKVPFDSETGHMLRDGRSYRSSLIEWVDNHVFHAKLKFIEFGYNQHAIMEEVEYGKRYNMVLYRFEELLKDEQQPIFPGCVFEADWTFYKQGNTFSLKKFNPEDDKV